MKMSLSRNTAVTIEEFDFKEPTPSIAPSIYESAQYSKKWRILLAIFLGCTLIGLCMLGFFINAENRADRRKALMPSPFESSGRRSYSPNELWRIGPNQGCSSTNANFTCPEGYGRPPILLIGIDGLRSDFVTLPLTPSLHHLAQCGVTADSLVPVFPTNGFPNFYSIVTGLYPESHGIIDNTMFDPKRQVTFNTSSSTSYRPFWWGGEPIWNTLTNQGKKAYTYYWVGSDVLIQNEYPTKWEKYKESIPYTTRVDEVINWLKYPTDKRPDLITLYLEQPDNSSHTFGPFSQQANDSLKQVSNAIDDLMTKLEDQNLFHCVDIIIVSDHGMAQSACSKSVYFQSFNKTIPNIENKIRLVTGPVGRIRANDGNDNYVFKKLRCKNPNLRVASKELLPKRYHYANNERIENVILDSKPGYRVVTASSDECTAGEHGFDNIEGSMQASFVGFGPSFKSGVKVKSFRNVELYNLICDMIGVEPAPNNGTRGSLSYLLKKPSHKEESFDDSWILKETVEEFKVPSQLRQERNSNSVCSCSPEVADGDVIEIKYSNIFVTEKTTASTPSSTTSSTTTTAATTTSSSTTTATTTPTQEPSTSESSTSSSTELSSSSEKPINQTLSTSTIETSTTSTPKVSQNESLSAQTTQSSVSTINTNMTESTLISITTSSTPQGTTKSNGNTENTLDSSSISVLKSTTESSHVNTVTTSLLSNVTDKGTNNTDQSELLPSVKITDSNIIKPIKNNSVNESIEPDAPFPNNTLGKVFEIDKTNTSDELNISLDRSPKLASILDNTSEVVLDNPEEKENNIGIIENISNLITDNQLNNKSTSFSELANNETTTVLQINPVHSSSTESIKNITLDIIHNDTSISNNLIVNTTNTKLLDTDIYSNSSSDIEYSETTTDPISSITHIPVQSSSNDGDINITSSSENTTESSSTNITTDVETTTQFISLNTNVDISSQSPTQVPSTNIGIKSDTIDSSTTNQLSENITVVPKILNSKPPNELQVSSMTSITNNKSIDDSFSTTTPATDSPPVSTKETVIPSQEINVRKKRQLSNIRNKITTHCPWETPKVHIEELHKSELKVLLQTNYVIGMPLESPLPLWISFTYSNSSLESNQDSDETKRPVMCWARDDRIKSSSYNPCDTFLNVVEYENENIKFKMMFPEELEDHELLRQEGFLLSNLLPVRKGYLESGRRVMVNAIKSWTSRHDQINVVHGPIFDYDLDGKRDNYKEAFSKQLIVPSNYFFVVSICKYEMSTNSSNSANDTVTSFLPKPTLRNCPIDNFEVLAFVFPNTDYNDSCQLSDEEYLRYHLTNLKDVEMLTGIKFFKSIVEFNDLSLSIRQPLSIWPLIDPENENKRFSRLNYRKSSDISRSPS